VHIVSKPTGFARAIGFIIGLFVFAVVFMVGVAFGGAAFFASSMFDTTVVGELYRDGGRNTVAIIPIEGIIDAHQAESVRLTIDHVLDDSSIKAAVLRVDSPGGGIAASDQIWYQVKRLRDAGLPVIASYGGVAASGGYYVSCGTDHIVAEPTCITGSIGVIAAFPTLERLFDRFGVHTDGVGTTELAGSLRLDRPLNPQLAASITSSVENSYRGFVGLVAQGRGMTPEAVDSVAQGRVWSAPDALERGLIDSLGHLEDAIRAAAQLANLEDYEVEYISLPLSPRDQLMQLLADRVGSLQLWVGSSTASAMSLLVRPAVVAAQEIGRLNDPANLYMRCFACGATN